MKKKYIIAIIVAVFILIDLSVLLYPSLSAYVNARSQSRAVAHYFDDVAGMDDTDIQAILEAAREYNRDLLRMANRFNYTQADTARYKALLNTGRGVMGVLAIDKINVKLPIYHGTDEDVLQVGLGHLQGTSLPVGGTGTHAFITGHRGLPSSTLLTELDKLAEGDTFALYIMGETLTYRVDNIQTVLPEEVSSLDIDPDMDYCTLVTCTPYGVNSHRLLVRGYRIENLNPGWDAVYADARRLDKALVILLFLAPAVPALVIYLVIRCRKIRKGGCVHR